MIPPFKSLLDNVRQFLATQTHSIFLGRAGKFGVVDFGPGMPPIIAYHMTTPEMRKQGMQAFNSMDPYCGLFFPHAIPQYVTYHMGTTKFPIDIMFLSLDSVESSTYTITKIVSNVHPGDRTIFKQDCVSGVLETVGNFAREHEMSPGDTFRIVSEDFSKFPTHRVLMAKVSDVTDDTLDFESSSRIQRLHSYDQVYLVELDDNNEYRKHEILSVCDIPRERAIWVLRG